MWVLMSTHNICFYGEIMKIIPKISQNTPLICSTEFIMVLCSRIKYLGYNNQKRIWNGQEMPESKTTFSHCIKIILNSTLLNIDHKKRGYMSCLMIKPTKSRVPSEDSDQPEHLPRLIRVFAVRWMGSSGPKLSSCGQRRLRSDWADVQADRSLHWAHMPFCWFCHEVAHMVFETVSIESAEDLLHFVLFLPLILPV